VGKIKMKGRIKARKVRRRRKSRNREEEGK
jgi:hypothetical protein